MVKIENIWKIVLILVILGISITIMTARQTRKMVDTEYDGRRLLEKVLDDEVGILGEIGKKITTTAGASIRSNSIITVDFIPIPSQYIVERSDGAVGGPYSQVGSPVPYYLLTLVDDTVTAGMTIYYYKVRAEHQWFTGELSDDYGSDYAYTVPGPTTDPVLTADNYEIDITWYAPQTFDTAGPVTFYEVWRSTNGSDYGSSAHETIDHEGLQSTQQTYTDNLNVLKNTNYWYKTKAGNVGGTSVFSVASGPVEPNWEPDAPIAPILDSDDTYGGALGYVNGLNYGGTTGSYYGKAMLEWTAPDGNGYSITDYEVRCTAFTPDPGATTTNIYYGWEYDRATSYWLSGGTSYQFEVRAYNQLGWGPWSSTSGSIKAIVPPADPSFTGASILEEESIKIDWDAPGDWGGADPSTEGAAYLIEISTNGVDFSPIESSYDYTAVTYTDSGLTGGQQYWYRISGKNNWFTGDYDEISQYAYSTPDPPTTPTLAPAFESINVEWYAGTNWDACGWIHYYVLERSATGPATGFSVVTGGDHIDHVDYPGTPQTFNDPTVVPNTDYWYRVTAYSLPTGWDSPVSTAGGPEKGAFEPDASMCVPRIKSDYTQGVYVNGYGYTGTYPNYTPYLCLEWDAADANGDPGGVTGYIITIQEYVESYGSGVVEFYPWEGTTPLEAGNQYHWCIKAENSVGWSDFSPWSNPITAVVPPDKPVNTSTSAYAVGEIEITWDPPSNWGYLTSGPQQYVVERSTGGGYTAVQTQDHIGASDDEQSYIDQGLTGGQQYWYRIRAKHYLTGEPSDASATICEIELSNPATLNSITKPAPLQLRLNWTPSQDLETVGPIFDYLIYRQDGFSGGFNIVATPLHGGSQGSVQTWTDSSGLETYTVYHYYVVERNSIGEISPVSETLHETVYDVPECAWVDAWSIEPTTGNPDVDTYITWTFEDFGDPITQYEVYWKETGAWFLLETLLGSPPNNYTTDDQGGTAGVSRSYYVVATNSAGPGGDETYADTLVCVTDPIQLSTVTLTYDVDPNNHYLEWNTIASEAGRGYANEIYSFVISRKVGAGGAWGNIGEVTEPGGGWLATVSYVDDQVQHGSGLPHFYQVSAKNDGDQVRIGDFFQGEPKDSVPGSITPAGPPDEIRNLGIVLSPDVDLSAMLTFTWYAPLEGVDMAGWGNVGLSVLAVNPPDGETYLIERLGPYATAQETLDWVNDLTLQQTPRDHEPPGDDLFIAQQTYTDYDLDGESYYYYHISVQNIAGFWSTPVEREALIPSQPAPPTLSQPVVTGSYEIGDMGVDLQWDRPYNGRSRILFYTIYRSENGVDFVKLDQLTGGNQGIMYYLDNNGIKSGQQYFYKVTATNLAGESDDSNVQTVTTSSPYTSIDLSYIGSITGLSWYLASYMTSPTVVRKDLGSNVKAGAYENLSFDIRVDNVQDYVTIIVEDDSTTPKQFRHALDTEGLENFGWKHFDLFLLADFEGETDTDILTADTIITAIKIEFSSADFYLDNISLSGRNGLLLIDDFEYASKLADYEAFILEPVPSSRWIEENPTSVNKIMVDDGCLDNSVEIIDLNTSSTVEVFVEGAIGSTLTLMFKPFTEAGVSQGAYLTVDLDLDNPQTYLELSGWGTVDKVTVPLPYTDNETRFLAYPRVGGTGDVVVHMLKMPLKDGIVNTGYVGNKILSEGLYENWELNSLANWTASGTVPTIDSNETPTRALKVSTTGVGGTSSAERSFKNLQTGMYAFNLKVVTGTTNTTQDYMQLITSSDSTVLTIGSSNTNNGFEYNGITLGTNWQTIDTTKMYSFLILWDSDTFSVYIDGEVTDAVDIPFSSQIAGISKIKTSTTTTSPTTTYYLDDLYIIPRDNPKNSMNLLTEGVMYLESPDFNKTVLHLSNYQFINPIWDVTFNEGKFIIHDLSKNDNFAIPKGTSTKPVFNPFITAFEFNGTDDYLEVKDDDSLDLIGELTFGISIYPTGLTGTRQIIYKDDNVFNLTFNDEGTDNAKLIWNIGGSDETFNGTDTINPNEWNDIVFVREYTGTPSEYRHSLIVNGKPETTPPVLTGDLYKSSSDLLIGIKDDLTNDFEGWIKNFIVFEEALTNAEAMSLIAGMAQGYYVPAGEEVSRSSLNTGNNWTLSTHIRIQEGYEGNLLSIDTDDGKELIFDLVDRGDSKWALGVKEVEEPPEITYFEIQTLTDASTESWKTVTFNNTYSNPRVFYTVVGVDTTTEIAARVRNVTSTSCELTIQNSCDSSPVVINNGTLYLFVIEDGLYETDPNLPYLKTGTITTTKTGYKNNWASSNAETITVGTWNGSSSVVIFHNVITENDTSFVESWCSNAGSRSNPPTSTSFWLGLNHAEVNESQRTTAETIHWMMVDVSSGSGWQVVQTSDVITDMTNNNQVTHSLGETPVWGLWDQQEMDGKEGSWGQWEPTNFTPNYVEGYDQEDTIRDSETTHTSETSAFWIVGSSGGGGEESAIPLGFRMETVVVTDASTETWKTVEFNNGYTDPRVFYTLADKGTTVEIAARVRNIKSDSCEIIIQNSCDASPVVINDGTVYLLIIENGEWNVDGLPYLKTGSLTTSTTGSEAGGWNADSVNLGSWTGSDQIVVFHNVVTNNDPSFVETWCKGSSQNTPPTPSNINIGLNTAETASSHGEESIHWMVVEVSSGVGWDLIQTTDNVEHSGYSSNPQDHNLSITPKWGLWDQQEMSNSDGSWGQFEVNHFTSSKVTGYVQEDTIGDSEVSHRTRETCGFWVMGEGISISYASVIDYYSSKTNSILNLPLLEGGGTQVYDPISEYIGTIHSNLQWTKEGLQFPNGLVGENIIVDDELTLNTTDEFVFEALVRLDGDTSGSIFEITNDTQTNTWIKLRIDETTGDANKHELIGYVDNIGSSKVVAEDVIINGSWHKVTMILEKETLFPSLYSIKLLIDQRVVAITKMDVNINSGLIDVIIGDSWNGYIRDVNLIEGPLFTIAENVGEYESINVLAQYDSINVNIESYENKIIVTANNRVFEIPKTGNHYLTNVTIGDPNSNKPLYVDGFGITSIETQLSMRPCLFDNQEVYYSKHVINTADYTYSDNTLEGNLLEDTQEVGIEITVKDVPINSWLVALVEVDAPTDVDMIVYDDWTSGSALSIWDITTDDEWDSTTSVKKGTLSRIVIPLGGDSLDHDISFYLQYESGTHDPADVSLTVVDYILGNSSELEGEIVVLTTSDSDIPIISGTTWGIYSIKENNASNTTIEIPYDYTITKYSVMSFEYKINTGDTANILTKLALDTTRTDTDYVYYMDASTGGFRPNDIDKDGNIDKLNQWVIVDIPIYDFFKEYYSKGDLDNGSDSLESIVLTTNENAQDASYFVEIKDLVFYENKPATLRSIMNTNVTKKQAASNGDSIDITNWMSSMRYDNTDVDFEDSVIQTNYVINGDFSEFSWTGSYNEPRNWTKSGGGYVTATPERGVKIIGGTPTTQLTQDMLFGYSVDASLRFGAFVKVDATIPLGDAYVSVGSETINIPIDSTEWTYIERQFNVTDTSGITMSICSDTTIPIYIDDARLDVQQTTFRDFDPERIAIGGSLAKQAHLEGWSEIFGGESSSDPEWVRPFAPFTGEESISDDFY